MARDGGDGLIIALLTGAALYWWWQQQNASLAAQTGVTDTLTGTIDSLETSVGNYMSQNTIGTTRGERNNNPGNLDLKNGSGQIIQWQGLSPTQTDNRFAQFTDVVYGIRALHKNTLTIFNRGANTVQALIGTYAPPKENNTAAYIAAVCTALGVTPTTVIDMTDANTANVVCDAIIKVENGSNPYVATGQFAQGMAMS